MQNAQHFLPLDTYTLFCIRAKQMIPYVNKAAKSCLKFINHCWALSGKKACRVKPGEYSSSAYIHCILNYCYLKWCSTSTVLLTKGLNICIAILTVNIIEKVIKTFCGHIILVLSHTMSISPKTPHFSCFFKLGFIRYTAKQPLKRMMLREKEENDEKHIEKLFRKYIGKLLQYQSRKLNQKIHNSINLSAKKTIIDIRIHLCKHNFTFQII